MNEYPYDPISTDLVGEATATHHDTFLPGEEAEITAEFDEMAPAQFT